MSRVALSLCVLVLVLGVGFWALTPRAVDVPTTSITVQNDTNEAQGTSPPPSTSGAASSTPSTINSQLTTLNSEPVRVMQATLHTSAGDITIEFMNDAAPNTVANFTKLAGEGFYNGTKFHRVIEGFMIQGGDPLTKDDGEQARWGTGGPGYKFADEIHAQNRNMIGTIAMANSGPNTNGSQFFINVADNNFLDPKHTVFGKVVAGMDVVDAIGKTETTATDRPLTPIVITSVDLK